jgi:protein TonB
MADGGITVFGIRRKPWAWAILGSFALHGLLLGAAFFCISQGPTRLRRVVLVETISLIPGPPGLCGGDHGITAPMEKPKPSAPKTKARQAPSHHRLKPLKTSPPRQNLRAEIPPPPPSPVLARPIAPGPQNQSRQIGRQNVSGASAGAASGSGAGPGVGQGAGTGSGTRGSGTGGGGSSLYSYLQQVRRLLEQQKHYPPAARRQHLEGVVVLRFTIAASGRVESINLSRSSGHGILDSAAQEALKRVDKFPPLPADLGRQTITIEVPLAFRLVSG